MRYSYGEYDGQPFPSPDDLFPSSKLVNFILEYGEQALDAMQTLEGDEADMIRLMIEAGLLEEVQDEDGNTKLQMTPRMLKGMQHQALLEIFRDMDKSVKGSHETSQSGRTTERSEGNKAYEFGDPLSEVDLGATLRNVMRRQVSEDGKAVLPLQIQMDDFEVHQTEARADCATVLLMDLSGSMMRYGRFLQAKRVAMGLKAMIEQRFPQDTLEYVGFYSLAEPMREQDVPLVMPKPVTIRDWEVKLRVPVQQARENMERMPLHFTNLQMGLREARRILAKRGASNKQIFIITDGQPTAHVQTSPDTGEEMLYLLYPPTEETSTITLQEAVKCQQQGIRIASFALIEDYWGMDWVGFIDQLTRLTRGTAFYNTGEDLASTVIESYLSGRKTRKFTG